MASNQPSANKAINETGPNSQASIPPVLPASDTRATNGKPDNGATILGPTTDIDTNPGPTSASRPSFLSGLLHIQDEHQDTAIDLQTGVATSRPFTGPDRHRDSLCDLPHLVERQDVESQRIHYAFLLLAGPGDWGNTVQFYNYLFHRTSDIITYDGHLVAPAPPTPPLATEASIKAMLEEQDLYPIDEKDLFGYMDELFELERPFMGQGRQQGMRFELVEVFGILRDWIEEAGIQMARTSGMCWKLAS